MLSSAFLADKLRGVTQLRVPEHPRAAPVPQGLYINGWSLVWRNETSLGVFFHKAGFEFVHFGHSFRS